MIDLTDQVFGKLTVIERVGTNRWRASLWKCQCSCGNVTILPLQDLRTRTRSCGCLHIEDLIKRSTKHGMHETATYRVWAGIKQRCNNSKNKSYANYGARGIKVCDRWNESFKNFLVDMGERPKGMSIERINNDGNYELQNCKWATRKEQNKNKRSNLVIRFNGQTKTLREWSDDLNIKYNSLHHRMSKCGWSVEKAFTTPWEKGEADGRTEIHDRGKEDKQDVQGSIFGERAASVR